MKSIVLNRDNMAIADYPDKHFDLAVIDPPYGLKMASRNAVGAGNKGRVRTYAKSDWDNTPPPKEFFDELLRVSKNQIIFGANHFISRIPFDSSCWIVWDKDNGGTDFADCELAWTSFTCSTKIYHVRWNGMLQADMKNKEERIHLTHKPVALYKQILMDFAYLGDKILDTHVGGGSSRIACYDLGLSYTGFEIAEDIFARQEKRFAKHKQNASLFKPQEVYKLKEKIEKKNKK